MRDSAAPTWSPPNFKSTAAEAGARLDSFLAARLPALSRSRIQALINDGHVTLNGRATKASTRLRAGDFLTLVEPPPVPAQASPEDIALEMLFEDADLLVLNKPPDMVVHPAAGNWTGTLVNALLHHCEALSGIGGEQRPGIVHRLDKDTSGCLVVAKSDLAHQSLARQFAGREVTKIYLALAAGSFRTASGVIDGAIGRHPVHRKKMTVLTDGRGRAATHRLPRAAEMERGTLVECTLHTGRTHQIRVHLEAPRASAPGRRRLRTPRRFSRQMLHAWKLGFTHPRAGERMNFQSPIPADFVEAGVPCDLP